VERRKRFEELPEKVARSMEELDPGAALHLIMNGVYSVRSIDPKAPEI